MRLFLTDAHSLLGKAVAEKLKQAGHAVVALAGTSSSAHALLRRGIEPHIGDLFDYPSLARAARECDGVIRTEFVCDIRNLNGSLASEKQAVAALIEALAYSGKPLVLTSSSAVLGDTSTAASTGETCCQSRGQWFLQAQNEQLAIQGVIPDFLAITSGRRSAADRKLHCLPEVCSGQCSCPVLAFVLHDLSRLSQGAQASVRVVVLRLPLYFIERAGRVWSNCVKFEQGWRAYYVGDGSNKASLIHVDDAAHAYLRALELAAPGSLYNIAASGSTTTAQLAHLHAKANGTGAQAVSIEQAQEAWGSAAAHLLSVDNEMASEEAREVLNWNSPSSDAWLRSQLTTT